MTSPLFVRSVYSLLSSMCPIDGIISKCLEYGYKSCAIVDKNVLSGAMSFKKACIKNGIKPIFGMEFDCLVDEHQHAMMMLAKNNDGYKNLIKLSTFINTNDEKVIDIEVLNKYRSNNILVLFSDDMPLSFAIDKNNDYKQVLQRQKELFGEYYVGLVDHDIAANRNRSKVLKPVLDDNKVNYFALNRTYYLNKEDSYEYEVMKCIRDKKTISDENIIDDENRYFLSPQEYTNLYENKELLNCDILASLCNADINFKTDLPVYQNKNGVQGKDYLVNLCKAGLEKRLSGNISKQYADRLDYELKVIIKMHFENYFLIVYDFILFAKKSGIMVGPGRGSAAGSLVSYCLGITDIDPIKYGLLFERFLNPERISMPDIDTDFPDDKRDLVFNYVKEKYGINHVGHIITYGTLKAKQVLRDVGRVLEYPNDDIDSICKLIPFAYSSSLKATYDNVPFFKQKIESETRFRKLFNTALKLESYPRHESTHAAGVVFSSLDFSEVVPMIKIENDIYSTQYTMEHLEELGLIKMDFLGLRNLGIIAEVVEDINKHEHFDIKKIPLDDEKTFKLIDDVNVLGVFQLESNGMQNLARKMHPNSFEELGMMIALFRPGPMENIPDFLNNRAHPERITYLVKELEPILKETYGIIVYQEQIMTIARVLAGFSYGKADLLRRAMSKKKAEELEKLASDFIDGCINNGYSKDVALKLYELILKFANYGFNKSHSIAYGMVAYQMAYLKANYPLYFYKALLNGTVGSQTKTYEYINECQRINQKVKAISINNSKDEYTIIDDAIIMPFGACKDVGSASSRKIIEERNENGPFTSYLSTITRLVEKGVDKNVIENLIYAGAFDEFEYSRYTMIKSLDNVLKYANNHKGITMDLGFDDAPAIISYKDDLNVLSKNELRVYGFYFSYNPILEIKKQYNINTEALASLGNKAGYAKGFGLINHIKTHKTKNGQMMAFVDIGDDTGDLSLVLMPNLYLGFNGTIKEAQYIYFEGNIEKQGSCLVKKATIIGG